MDEGNNKQAIFQSDGQQLRVYNHNRPNIEIHDIKLGIFATFLCVYFLPGALFAASWALHTCPEAQKKGCIAPYVRGSVRPSVPPWRSAS